MITPSKIQEIADPVEGIYINCVNELMVNIGKHITSPTWTHTASWEIQKLSEMGQLTKENAAIINKWIKQIPPAMRSTMEATRAAALDRLEKQMEQAEKDGYIQPPLADSTVQIFKDYADQAVDKMNMVNTTMLQSTLSQYQKAVNMTADIMAQAEATQNALNAAAGSVSTGVETRTKAMQRAIKTIADEGLTGFYDRAGRSWSPEAYVNMVIRTTVHNTAIQATESRMKDYGTDVFQISSHAGARPLCYPYQGWFCSWSNTSGEIELGDGSIVQYKPLNETSYGQPAGIFGINCGHYPIPIIAGYTIPHGADNIQPEEENDKAYALSQEQRALERQVRAAKRVVEMGNTSDEAKQAVKDAQAKMRQFIADTGRTRRYDRESLYGGKKVNTQLTTEPKNDIKIKEPVEVKLGDKLEKSLGSNADEFRELVRQNPNVAATYNAYAGELQSVEQRKGAGVYKPALQKIEWDYSKLGEKYETLGHEFGHHVDARMSSSLYTSNEAEAVNKLAGTAYWKPVKTNASSSDQFLSAMRADRSNLMGYVNDKTERERIHNDLMSERNLTAGIQDAFDGWWSTQDSTTTGFYLPWGHGNKYYNRTYNNIKTMGGAKGLQDAYNMMGFDASNQAKTKKIARDYDAASELWANIQAAETVGGKELDYMKKYFPNATKTWEDFTGRI